MRAILTYHSIDESASPISVSRASFRAHLAWLTSGRVRVMDVPSLLALQDDQDAVALTFDDGYASLRNEVVPLLAATGLPATVFVVSRHTGRDNQWGGVGDPGIPALPLLGWRDIEMMAQNGWTIGAHTRTHPRLSTCSPDAIIEELEGCHADITQALGMKPTAFAYPYGAVTPLVATAVASCYSIGCTTEFRAIAATDSSTLIPRLDAWYFRNPRRLDRWGSPQFRRWLAIRHTIRKVRRFP